MQNKNLTNPDEPDATHGWLARADALEEQGRPSEALRLLERIGSDDPIVLTRIGVLQYDLERWTEAEASFEQVLKLEPELWAGYFYLGLVYRAQGRLEAAEAALQRAVKHEESAPTFTVLGVVQLDLGLKQSAQESFRRALALDPDDEEALYNLATTLVFDSQSEAVALFERAIEIDPNYSLAHRELGWLFRRMLRVPEADYHLRRAIELNPDDGWSYIYLGNLMWQAGELEIAENAFRDVIKIWPERGIGYWCLGHFFECLGRVTQAESFYAKGIQVDPGDAQANWRLGNYLKSIGQYDRAKAYLTTAIEFNPTDKRVWEALAGLEKQFPNKNGTTSAN